MKRRGAIYCALNGRDESRPYGKFLLRGRNGVRLFPSALRRSDNLAGFQILRGDADFFDSAVFNDFDSLQVRDESACRDTRGFKTDAAGLFGDTAAGDFLAHMGFFACKVTNSGHSLTSLGGVNLAWGHLKLQEIY